MKEITGIRIDAVNSFVEVVKVDPDNFEDINKAIGCDIFCIGARLKTGDILYVDDMGWLDPKVTRAFQFGGDNTVLPRLSTFAGNGLILGLGPSGNSRNARTTWIEAMDAVHFPRPDWVITDPIRQAAMSSVQLEILG